MKKLIITAIIFIGSANLMHAHPFFIRVYGSLFPAIEHTPVTREIFNFNGLVQIIYRENSGLNVLNGSAGVDVEYVLPLDTEFGLSVLLGSKFVFPQSTPGGTYFQIPIFAGFKASYRLIEEWPWSVYVITRLGYNLFAPSAEYKQFVEDNIGSEFNGFNGLYFNAAVGTEVLTVSIISVILELGYDFSYEFISPPIIQSRRRFDISEQRLEILLGVSLDI